MRIAVLLFATVIAILTVSALVGLRLNLTGSMPVGLYRIARLPLSRNTTVLACLPPRIAQFAHARAYVPNGYCKSGTAPIGKEIVAVGGDTVSLTAAGIEVNGRLLLNSRPLRSDARGRPLPQWEQRRRLVRSRELWLLSTNSARGFDSRYFGALPDDCVVAAVVPLLTRQ